MDIYEALYTTRAMRRVRPDPIPLEVQARMLDAAIRAPSGGNSQNWRFLLADDTDVIGRIGPLYRHSIDQLWETVYAERLAAAEADPEADERMSSNGRRNGPVMMTGQPRATNRWRPQHGRCSTERGRTRGDPCRMCRRCC